MLLTGKDQAFSALTSPHFRQSLHQTACQSLMAEIFIHIQTKDTLVCSPGIMKRYILKHFIRNGSFICCRPINKPCDPSLTLCH